MKTLKGLIGVCVLSVVVCSAAEISEADKKWSEAVEKMIVAGSATISTPLENRAKLAKELAAKLGRDGKIEKTEKGYKIAIGAAKTKSPDIAKIENK